LGKHLEVANVFKNTGGILTLTIATLTSVHGSIFLKAAEGLPV